jgi:hypothetical protein
MKSPDGKKARASTAFVACIAGLLGLILTPVLVNLLGALAFHDHPSYDTAQGLGSLFFFLSILSALPGALYWVTIIVRMRGAEDTRRAVLIGAAIYVLLVLDAVLGIGGSYVWSYGRSR